jgi:1-acyl-sn-glycerol-3-phosphate acyltransferase
MTRTALRLAALAACMAAAFAVAPAFRLLPAGAQQRLKILWSKAALAALGIRTVLEGEPPVGGCLVVANHVSWLDIPAIACVRPASFLCKEEIGSWPAIGWLLRQVGTVFMRRGSAFAAWRAVKAIGPRLAAGESLSVFPEGTTTPGHEVKPFFPAMFQAAVDSGNLVQPVALAYTDAAGQRSYACAYEGETSFGESLLAIAATESLIVTVSFLPAFSAAAAGGRKAAGRHAHAMIASRIRHAGVAVPSSDLSMLRPA